MPGPFSRSNIFMIRQICIRRCQIASIYPHPFPADQGQPILRLIDRKGIRWSTVDVDLVPFHSEVANPSYQSIASPALLTGPYQDVFMIYIVSNRLRGNPR